eukprot:gnl/MRDRNA2_/MRDRNA2_75700_c0_seq3.p1 gnl/MRDRNA2_/MRDRNA2_75700_c0~~gnl/MRDRNA2_/MRDRNA2_75700_c0_seq3.p1  ORF type:complete len:1275 (-),score=168.89 gnl/MRDRNA2_/MRDRNA2_75700_c0_seq3:61-3597(-)
MTELFRQFALSLRMHSTAQQKLREDHKRMVLSFKNVETLTHPEDPAFTEAKGRLGDALKEQRTNMILCDDLLNRLIEWCLKQPANYQVCHVCIQIIIEYLCLQGPPEAYEALANGVSAAVETMCDWNTRARQEFRRQQAMLAQRGVTDLLTCVLASRNNPSRITEQAFELAELILAGGNKDVQNCFAKSFRYYNSASFFGNIQELSEQAINCLKQFRRIKNTVAGNGSVEEHQSLQIFKHQRRLKTLRSANRMLQLLCEGHNVEMQTYLRQQDDNTASVNVLEHTSRLLSRLCPNQAALDEIDCGELSVISSGLDLLIEMLRGPCAANQAYLTGTGIIELFMKICKGNFALIVSLEGDDAIKILGSLKCLVFVCINAMLEGLGEGTEVHKAAAIWLDTKVLKERLIKAHAHFLEHFCSEDVRKRVASSPRELTEEEMQTALSSLTEEDIENVFQEPLELMILVRAVKDIDARFSQEITPCVPSAPDKVIILEPMYSKLVKRHRDACQYQHAYSFFSHQVRGIEVVLSTQKLSMIYFRKPLSAWHLLASTKANILNTIDLSTQDVKIHEFIESVLTLMVQLQHTQALATLRVPFFPGPLRRPFGFFLAHDNQNIDRLAWLNLLIALTINLILIFSIGDVSEQFAPKPLPGRLGRILKKSGTSATSADSSDDASSIQKVSYISDAAENAVIAVAALYILCSAIVLFLTLMLFVPVFYAQECHAVEDLNRSSKSVVLGVIGCIAVLGSFVAAIYIGNLGDEFNPWWPLIIVYSTVLGVNKFFKALGPSRPAFLLARIVGTFAEVLKFESLASCAVFLYLAFTALLTDQPFYFGLLLFGIVFVNHDLRGVLDAVIIPAKSLFLMFCLMFIVLFNFAFHSFLSYRHQFVQGECDGLASCFFYVVLRASTYGGGLGEYFERDLTSLSALDPSRALFDYMTFWIFNIVIFNMVAGLIIDTFGSVRDEKADRLQRLTSFCFISGFHMERIEKAALNLGIVNGFVEHTNHHQNKWDYAGFILSLNLKNPTDRTGIESYIAEQLARGDNRWIPSSRCMFVERAEKLHESSLDASGEERVDDGTVASGGATGSSTTSSEMLGRLTSIESWMKTIDKRISGLEASVKRSGSGLQDSVKRSGSSSSSLLAVENERQITGSTNWQSSFSIGGAANLPPVPGPNPGAYTVCDI